MTGVGWSREGAGTLRAGALGALLSLALACASSSTDPDTDRPTATQPSSSASATVSPPAPTGGAAATGEPVPTASSVASAPAPPATGAGQCAAATLARLTPSERAAQVLMLGVPVATAGAAASSVRSYRPGGVFLRGRSAQRPAEVARQIRVLQQAAGSGAGVPLHVAVDQEGGQVQTLRGPGFDRLPTALVQGRWDTATLQGRTARWAATLHDVGVTMNFAPVADTVPGPPRRNPPIGASDRHYGSSPDAVAEDVSAVTRGLQGAGVVATLKHFPGLGRVRANTDLSPKAVDEVTSRSDPHLRPFAAGISAGAGAVMMSSARYPRLDARQPAMFSAQIVGMLRTDLGFTGLIVSDDLGAAGAVRDVPVGRRAVAFVAAGGDMVLTIRRADAGPMGAALVAAAKGSPAFRRRLDDAVLHVLASKERAGLLRCPVRPSATASPTAATETATATAVDAGAAP